VSLARRLFVGSLVVVVALVLFVVSIIDRRIGARLIDETTRSLAREARLVALQWTRNSDADSLANLVGAALGHRVTLIDSAGTVIGDSEFDGPALHRLENHATRPEIVASRTAPFGSMRRVSSSAGDEELYVAVRAPLGTARVSVSTAVVDGIVSRARQDVLIAALVSILIAMALAALLARSISRPMIKLRDGANRMAAGDLTHRFALIGPGEVGDLAVALRRMADELASRIRALETEDTLMVALIESLSEGVIALDARSQVVRINDSAQHLLGLSRMAPFHADQLPRDRLLRDSVARALRGESVEPVEATIHDRTLILTSRPLPDGGAVLTIFDLTPLRRIEAVRRDFVANASHELKTPLTVIRGFAETLVDDDPPAEQRRQFAEAIRSSAQRMQRLVDDLLDLSRIESGGWLPNPQEIEVRSVAEEVISASRSANAPAAVRIELAIGQHAERVVADPTALRQILSNLVDNALRHTESGFVRVFSEATPEGTWVGVTDSGQGIAETHLPRIFERFYRADPSRARDGGGGTGLGLAIVRHLVEAHGGRVRADSAVGRGTTVAALFPVPAQLRPIETAPARRGVPGAPDTGHGEADTS
jgi:two-component system, OmpR family, phosphate regulon sensor histidine kinase PhoR